MYNHASGAYRCICPLAAGRFSGIYVPVTGHSMRQMRALENLSGSNRKRFAYGAGRRVPASDYTGKCREIGKGVGK